MGASLCWVFVDAGDVEDSDLMRGSEGGESFGAVAAVVVLESSPLLPAIGGQIASLERLGSAWREELSVPSARGH